MGDGTVVDIGGSHARVSLAVARRFPNFKRIQSRALVRRSHPTLKERVQGMEHDFSQRNRSKASLEVAEIELVGIVVVDVDEALSAYKAWILAACSFTLAAVDRYINNNC